MRKITITIILLSIVYASHGQTIPSFITDYNNLDKNVIEKEFPDEYDFLLVFTESSFWFKNQKYFAIVLVDSTLSAYSWKVKSRKADSYRENNKKSRKELLNIDSSELEYLLDYFSELDFWSLENEPLNRNSKPINDSTYIHVSVSDGSSFRFISSNRTDIRTTYSTNPDTLNKKIPTADRDNFIACRNKFVEIVIERKTVANNG